MSVSNLRILVNDKPIEEAVEVKLVDTVCEVNKVAFAQVTFIDPKDESGNYLLSNSDDFVPGARVVIKLGYENNPESEHNVFNGIIVKYATEVDRAGGMLKLDIKEEAVRMTGVRKKNVLNDMTDSDLFRQLIENNKIEVGEIACTETQHAELVQYWCTDWDMLLSRADHHGFWVITQDNKIDILDPVELYANEADYKYEIGMDDVFSFTLEANAENQYGKVRANGWDVNEQEIREGDDAVNYNISPGVLKREELSGATGGGELELNSTIPMAPEELKEWANGKMRKSCAALIRGRITVEGNASIKVGEILELSGISKHFNGKTIISGVRQRYTTAGWYTDIQFGMDPTPFSNRPHINEPIAGGIIPAINGLQIGIIDNFEDDPFKEFRVKVKVPALGEENNNIWARFVTPDAGDSRGYFFLPETGDEVILGFLNNDPRHAIILGSVYSSAQTPPVENDKINEDNYIKGIYTKAGMRISFNDEHQTVEINTSDKNKISINEKNKKIEIKDLNDNNIVLDKSGITISCGNDFSLNAKGKVMIKGTEVDIQ